MTCALIARSVTPVLKEVEFVGACAFCDLLSGPWGWCLHCERIYPATKWRDNDWFCPASFKPIVWVQQMAAKKRA
jgi:hypothetical protein